MIAFLKKIPKGLTGVALVVFGAGFNFVPAIGPIASPYLMGAGVVLITGSAVDKSIRAFKGEDAFEREKALMSKFTTNKGDTK